MKNRSMATEMMFPKAEPSLQHSFRKTLQLTAHILSNRILLLGTGFKKKKKINCIYGQREDSEEWDFF